MSPELLDAFEQLQGTKTRHKRLSFIWTLFADFCVGYSDSDADIIFMTMFSVDDVLGIVLILRWVKQRTNGRNPNQDLVKAKPYECPTLQWKRPPTGATCEM